MKKIYTFIKDFQEQHKNITPVEHVTGVNGSKIEYLIDKDTLELFKVVKVYKHFMHSPEHGYYDFIVKQLETDGSARNGQGKPVVQINSRVIALDKIIAGTFIPNPNCLPDVIHKDGDKLNNNISNLRWATRSESVRLGIEKAKEPVVMQEPPKKTIHEPDYDAFMKLLLDPEVEEEVVWSTPPWWTKKDIERRDNTGITPDDYDPEGNEKRRVAYYKKQGIDINNCVDDEDSKKRYKDRPLDFEEKLIKIRREDK